MTGVYRSIVGSLCLVCLAGCASWQKQSARLGTAKGPPAPDWPVIEQSDSRLLLWTVDGQTACLLVGKGEGEPLLAPIRLSRFQISLPPGKHVFGLQFADESVFAAQLSAQAKFAATLEANRKYRLKAHVKWSPLYQDKWRPEIEEIK